MYFNTENESVEIKFSISFNKSSHNWATNQPIPIGYRVAATPVKITKYEGYSMEEFGAFTGFTDTLLEVDRQSAKRLETAKKVLIERLEQYLQWFVDRYGYSIPKLNELRA